MPAAPVEVPERLVQAIQDGDCVAFLGAGFTAAAGLPAWDALLKRTARGLEPGLRRHVLAKVAEKNAHAFDEAAQVLQDALGSRGFVERLTKALGRPRATRAMKRRLEHLAGIPFRGILTLNYDPVLAGDVTGPESYRAFLRPKRFRWWEDRFWGPDRRGAPVLKLHGDLAQPGTVVLTRRDYRRRLYQDPAYLTFLRSVHAQHTVLYLGFSFVDAYLNELRSEILSMVGQGRSDQPLSYAIVNDVPELSRRHFRDHEGVHVMSYDSKGPLGYGGFDAILEAIHERTDPELRFGRLLQDRRLLWVDPRPGNNLPVYRFFERVARTPGGLSFELVEARGAEDAVEELTEAQAAGRPFDLVLTHWGQRARRPEGSTAETLLREVRRRDLRSPVLIFSAASGADERKRKALALGALGYHFTFGGLLRGIEGVLAPGRETG